MNRMPPSPLRTAIVLIGADTWRRGAGACRPRPRGARRPALRPRRRPPRPGSVPRRHGARPRVPAAPGSRPVPRHLPPERRAAGLRRAVRRLGGAGRRAARALARPLPLGLLADVPEHGRPGVQAARGLHRRPNWPSARRRRPKAGFHAGYLVRVSRVVHRPRRGAARRSGRRGTPCTRSWPGCSTRTGRRQPAGAGRAQTHGRLGAVPRGPPHAGADAGARCRPSSAA